MTTNQLIKQGPSVCGPHEFTAKSSKSFSVLTGRGGAEFLMPQFYGLEEPATSFFDVDSNHLTWIPIPTLRFFWWEPQKKRLGFKLAHACWTWNLKMSWKKVTPFGNYNFHNFFWFHVNLWWCISLVCLFRLQKSVEKIDVFCTYRYLDVPLEVRIKWLGAMGYFTYL